MDFELNDEQRIIVETLRRFMLEEIIPLEQELDPDAYELPPAEYRRLVEKTTQMGFHGMDVPEELGGAGFDLTTLSLAYEEISQHRAGLFSSAYEVFGDNRQSQVMRLLRVYKVSDSQHERYLDPLIQGKKRAFFGLTEPAGGSDPARSIQTRAVRDGDVWVMNGSKIFISRGADADFGVVYARTDPEKGRRGITCFVVDTDSPGFSVRRIVHTIGSTEPITEISFDDVRLTDDQMLGEEGSGFALANETLMRGRLPYSAQSMGVAVAAQRMSTDYVSKRQTFGAPLATRQAIQWMIVDNEIDIRTTRWLILYAAAKGDRSEPFRFESSMAKLQATEAAGRVVDRAIQVHGGYGLTKDLPLERWYRELRIRRIAGGPSEIQRLILARDLIGVAS